MPTLNLTHTDIDFPGVISTEDVFELIQEELNEEEGFVVIHGIANWMATQA